MLAYAITTIDNPFDPFEQFELWYNFDRDHGYNSCGYMARLASTSDSFIDEENIKQVEKAIDMILMNDPNQIYKKVSKEVN